MRRSCAEGAFEVDNLGSQFGTFFPQSGQGIAIAT
jgi:hypothetical protein